MDGESIGAKRRESSGAEEVHQGTTGLFGFASKQQELAFRHAQVRPKPAQWGILNQPSLLHSPATDVMEPVNYDDAL